MSNKEESQNPKNGDHSISANQIEPHTVPSDAGEPVQSESGAAQDAEAIAKKESTPAQTGITQAESAEDKNGGSEEQASSAENTQLPATDNETRLPEEVPEAEPATEIESPYLGRFNACFNGLSKIGPLVLLAALACMAWPIFWQPGQGLYCPGEIKTLSAFLHCIATSSWLAPTGLENGAWTSAQWPVFTWAIGLMSLSPALVNSGCLLPATSFLCTVFAALGVWCLAHAARFGYRAAFAAGLILLCAPIFAPLANFVGPAALAAGFMLFALVFFCRGWQGGAAWISLPVAFVLTAIAGLAGGLLHFIVPFAVSFFYLVWRGNLRRAQKSDAIFGFILMLIILGCWLGVISLHHGDSGYMELLFASAWQWNWPIPLEWLLPLAAGILGLLPWTLMLFGVSWLRVISRAGKTLSASRRENGSALIWLSLIFSLCLAVFIPAFHASAVAIACLGATLLGKAATNLTNIGNRFFYLLAIIILVIAGCLVVCLSFEYTQHYILGLLPQLPIPDLGAKLLALPTLWIIGTIMIVGGLIALIFVKRFSGCGPLIYAILLVIIICQPARLSLVPELAAMPQSPLVKFSLIEAQVNKALQAPAVATPEAEPAPESTSPATPDEMPQQPEEAAPLQTAPEGGSQPGQSGDQQNPGEDSSPQAAEPNQESAVEPESTAVPEPAANEPAAPAQAEEQAPPEKPTHTQESIQTPEKNQEPEGEALSQP